MAEPYKRASDGRWVAALDEGWENGRRRRRVFYGKTKREAEQKRQDAIRKGARASRTGHTVETWLKEWMGEVHGHELKESTRRSHQSKIDRYLIPLLGKHRLDALEPKHVRRAWRRLQEPCPDPVEDRCEHEPSHGLAPATVRQTHAILKRALSDAMKDRLIFENVTMNVDAPSTETAQRDRLTSAQADLALKIAADDPNVSRWYVALRMGLRQSEALALPWGAVELDKGYLSVTRTLQVGAGVNYGTPKSKASNRTIAIEPSTAAHLRVHYARYVAQHGTPPPPDALVWSQDGGRPFGHRMDAKAWAQLLERAGLPHVALHSARATAASWLEETGWQPRMVAEYLGHTKVETTYIYQRGAGVERQAAAFGQIEG